MNSQEEAQELSERHQLHTLLNAIIPYLPQPVVEEQVADPEVGRVRGEYWEGSVLFADLSGFTALSETLSALGKQGAEEITTIVNDLFGALLEDVERYGGILLKFGGDAMTVYFGGEGHALRAARAGLAMQETMGRRFVNLETKGGVFTLRVRVGAHTGRIFAAQVGYEASYPLRGMELVVTGADINRVAEAQDYAAPGDVCITPETLEEIEAQAEVEAVGGGCTGWRG